MNFIINYKFTIEYFYSKKHNFHKYYDNYTYENQKNIPLEFYWSHLPTLKAYLKEKGISSKQMRLLGDNGQILVNNKKAYFNCNLNFDDVISIDPYNYFENTSLEAIKPQDPLHILFEDAHFLIVMKDHNILSHPKYGNDNPSLINYVYHYIKEVKKENYVPHIVTRLDKCTGGIVIFAKHPLIKALMHKDLNNTFIKKYSALVLGVPTFKNGIISYKMERCHPRTIRRGPHQSGQHSLSKYKLVKKDNSEKYSHLEFTIFTGKTHQIRVHCQSLGLPIVNDFLYDEHTQNVNTVENTLPLMLQCTFVYFIHPITKEHIKINAPFTKSLSQFFSDYF